MTMQKTIHSRDDIDRQYASGKEDGRGLASLEGCIDTSVKTR